MAQNQKAMQIEMAMKQRQAQLAMQQALAKERFIYFSVLYGLACFALPIGAVKSKNPKLVIPLVPLTLNFLFQYDMIYGSMMLRARREAARIIREEPERLFLPDGTGIVEQAQYNEIIGKSPDYKGKLNVDDHVFTVLHRHLTEQANQRK